jgi:hypothetical protein
MPNNNTVAKMLRHNNTWRQHRDRTLMPFAQGSSRSMADFSDKEDRLLVQLVLQQETRSATRSISWTLIAKKMRSRKKSANQLRMRIVNLKKRFGSDLSRFPRWYFMSPSTKDRRTCNKSPSTVPAADVSPDIEAVHAAGQLIQMFDDDDDKDEDEDTILHSITLPVDSLQQLDTPPATVAIPPKKLQRRPKAQIPTAISDTHSIVLEIFRSVTKSDVRQASGKLEYNVGELTAAGTTALIEACNFVDGDVFLDVGAGIGNVVAQVALETNIRSCIGVEIRAMLSQQGYQLIGQFSKTYPRLRKVVMHAVDICTVDTQLLRKTSVLFCHNTVFKPDAQLVVEQLCCRLPDLRVVILQQSFCSRHRPSCTREFCTLFRRRISTLAVSVTFTKGLRSLAVYDRIMLT